MCVCAIRGHMWTRWSEEGGKKGRGKRISDFLGPETTHQPSTTVTRATLETLRAPQTDKKGGDGEVQRKRREVLSP